MCALVWFLVLVFTKDSCWGIANPQLNLPPIPSATPTRPDIFYNSYTPNNRYDDRDDSDRFGDRGNSDRFGDRGNSDRFGDRGNSDRDRNLRFGPPYNDEDGDRLNDFRGGNRGPFGNDSFNRSLGRVPSNRPYNDNSYQDQDRRYAAEVEKVRSFVTETDHRGSIECTANVAAQWAFETDVSEITESEALLAQQRYADYQHFIVEQIRGLDRSIIFDEGLQRQLQLLSNVGPSALPADQLDRYNRLINDMLAIYNSASICEYQQPFRCGLRLQQDLKTIMARSRDWDEMQYVWTEWRRKTGKPMRDLYEQLIELINEVSYANNFTNAGEYWFSAFESPNLREDIEQVWKQIQPLYELLHAYVRRKLREYYGPDKINRNAPLPAHILGNMYGQSWLNILDITVPYPGKNFIDVSPRMLEQGYTPPIIFQLAEEFFLSLNMSAIAPDFWIQSILEQPPDRAVICQASAWDFCNRRDFRVKMCTKIAHKDLITAHHEMAHIQYFLHYRHQPKVYRDGANPGFHEAIGDAIGLSVSTPKHLQTLGLIQKSVEDTTYDINYLFAMAMDKVAFLPFALALENWRYDVFSKRVSREMLNCHYWDLREQYGGIKPPVLRSEMDFDVGGKYHIPANIPYMKYFVGAVLQFQIYRAMCIAARQYDPADPQKPLHKCDVYRQPEAGNVLRKLMEKGVSQPWQRVLEEAIGEARLDGSALRDYFRPLEEWLRNENLRNQEFVGWSYDGDYCKRSIETANLQVYGGFYNEAHVVTNRVSLLILCAFMLIAISW